MKKLSAIIISGISFVFAQNLIFQCDFSNNEAGLYTWQQVQADWKNSKGESPTWNNGIGFNADKGRPLDSARAWIVEEHFGQKKVLAVLYPRLAVGSHNSGVQWRLNLGANFDSATVEYKIFIPEGGDWGGGGKLPGFDGGTMPSGCVNMARADGFSARPMWRSGTNLSDSENFYATQYMYYRDKRQNCGDDFYWGRLPDDLNITDPQLYNACNHQFWSVINTTYGNAWPCSFWSRLKPYIARIVPGQWNTIRTYIRMNDADKTQAGNSNSIIKTWLNDSLVLDLRGLVLRDSDDFGIDAFYFSTFAGGSTPNFAPQTKDQIFYFDDFKIWDGEKPSDCDNNVAISARAVRKTDSPTISLNKREISVLQTGAKSMKIAVFTVNGRKIAGKNTSGEKVSFSIPKSARNAVIVKVEVDGNVFSQRLLLN
jgi:hypothetical protein